MSPTEKRDATELLVMCYDNSRQCKLCCRAWFVTKEQYAARSGSPHEQMHENKRVDIIILNSMLKSRRDKCVAVNGSLGVFAAVTYKV